jgi:hypothetical protein
VEVLHVSAERTLREVLGLPLRGEETLVQVSWRLAF